MNWLQRSSPIFIVLLTFCSLLRSSISVKIRVSNDGPAVFDVPITFHVELENAQESQFIYVFEDSKLYPRVHHEMESGPTANFTLTYKSGHYNPGSYKMNVQAYAVIWDFKAWLVAEATNSFVLTNNLVCLINISQEANPKAIEESFLIANNTANTTALIHDPSHFFENASILYYWMVDQLEFAPSKIAKLNYNFTLEKNYNVSLEIHANVSIKQDKPLYKFGRVSRLVKARYAINQLVVEGNTWLQFGDLLVLQVNCTGGSSPFWYCWNIFKTKKENFTCDEQEKVFTRNCSFPVVHYFSKNGTYYVEIGINNDVDFKRKTIQVNVFRITHQPQLFIVIIPIVSCILVIVIVVAGIAYHLQQRQRIAVEVADFDFQHTEDLNEKTFFERVHESVSKSVKGTFLHPCGGRSAYDDLVEDANQAHTSGDILTNDLNYDSLR